LALIHSDVCWLMSEGVREKLLFYIYILFKEILVYHFIETINLNILKSLQISNNEVVRINLALEIKFLRWDRGVES